MFLLVRILGALLSSWLYRGISAKRHFAAAASTSLLQTYCSLENFVSFFRAFYAVKESISNKNIAINRIIVIVRLVRARFFYVLKLLRFILICPIAIYDIMSQPLVTDAHSFSMYYMQRIQPWADRLLLWGGWNSPAYNTNNSLSRLMRSNDAPNVGRTCMFMTCMCIDHPPPPGRLPVMNDEHFGQRSENVAIYVVSWWAQNMPGTHFASLAVIDCVHYV